MAETMGAGHRASSTRPIRSLGASRDRFWLVAAVLIGAWVAARLGAFELSAVVAGADEQPVRLPVTFAGIDHPFHAARAEILRRSLLEGVPLRWIAQHQGGYPVEFYPLGVAWLEVAIWAMLLGSAPMMAAHKLVVIGLFLAPGVAYLLMARQDGWPRSTAVVAFVAHLMAPGTWWQGGYTELVEWGLVTNVAAACAALFVLVLLTGYLTTGSGALAAGATIGAAFALVTNPRSIVALGVVGLGTAAAFGTSRGGHGVPPLRVMGRLTIVAVLTAALAAPELVSLFRFGGLYIFTRYEWYADPTEYFLAIAQSVSWPVLFLAIVGLIAGLILPGRPLTRAAAITLVLYSVATFTLSFGPGAHLIANLETPRLMPFQRLLALYLAGVGVHALAMRLSSVLHVRSLTLDTVLGVGVVAALALLPMGAFAPASPDGEIPMPQRSLYPTPTTAAPEQAALAQAVRAADAASLPGTAILVLGSGLSWHQQLWAPFWTDRALFYDDWLWTWHARHVAPGYDPRIGNAYAPAAIAATLSEDFLRRHGVGAIVVADSERTAGLKRRAEQSPLLAPLRRGAYAVYAVRSPTTVVTFGDENASASIIANGRVLATGEGAGGEATIRQNWFPRWRATVNGRPVPVMPTRDGYMRVPVPVGDVRLELVYAADRVDWLARLGSVAAALVLSVLLVRQAWRWPRLRAGLRIAAR
jgi:hypothetical protein